MKGCYISLGLIGPVQKTATIYQCKYKHRNQHRKKHPYGKKDPFDTGAHTAIITGPALPTSFYPEKEKTAVAAV
jgi:hypothetical protein